MHLIINGNIAFLISQHSHLGHIITSGMSMIKPCSRETIFVAWQS